MSAVSTRGCFSPLQTAHPQVLRRTLEIEEPDISRLADKAVCQATTGWAEIRLAEVAMLGLHFACSRGCCQRL